MSQLSEQFEKLRAISTWTALITPLNEENKVQFTDLERLVREQEAAGNGLVVLGSTGESLNLDLVTKKDILHFVLKLRPQVPIMVGVGGHHLEEVLGWIDFLNHLKIAAYLMVTPIYSKPGPIGQFHWFNQLLDRSQRPVMLYNVPGRAGVKLSAETLKNLGHHPKLWGLKEASGSVEEMKNYKAHAPNVDIYCGDDALLYEFCEAGACGVVSVASNVWPEMTNLYTKKCLQQRLSNEDRKMWREASDTLFLASNPVPVKRLMYELGKISSAQMRLPLVSDDLKDITPLLNANDHIHSWWANQQ
jgi:4-hydroxy-tetrahydrodipicolinate synthase